MDNGATSNGNIMSVELAIERELEYRQKVKMFGLLPYGDSEWKEFLPLQVPVSTSKPSPAVPEMKQQPPFGSNKVQTSAPDPVVVQAQTTNPKPTQSLTRRPGPSPILAKRKAETGNVESRTDRFFCNLCQVPCSGASTYKMHIRGKHHAAELDNGRVCKNYGKSLVISHRCEICKISCTDEKALMMHFQGQKHLTRMQRLDTREECGVKEANTRKWCGLCRIWCIDESAFKQHCYGRKHIRNLHMKREGDEEDESILMHGLACDDNVS